MLAHIEDNDTDAGPAASRREPARTCLVTREVTPLDDMLRFVVAPDGSVVPDLSRNLPGRGAWVTATRAALEKAIKQNAFARAFRGKGKAGSNLVALVDSLLERSALDALSLANKAGLIVTGNTKVEAAILAAKIAALYHAAEAARDGKRKLDGLLKRLEAEGGVKAARFTLFAGQQLDLALGRANVVHAALLASPVSGGFLERSLRLKRWRDGDIAIGEDVPGKSNQELEHE